MCTSVSILGCGWLGLPLAEFLISNGFKVKGSTTTLITVNNLKPSGIKPFLIRLSEHTIEGPIEEFLLDSDILIIMVPPGLRHNPSKNHVSEMSLVIPYISRSQIKQVIYLSSISVFKDSTDFNLITNTSIPDAETNTAKQLGTIESLLLNNTAFKATVIRFGGLIGSQRHPGKYLAGKTALKNPEAPINLIHKTDCIHIIHRVLMAEPGNLAINAVYPWHPSKERYYTDYCLRKGLAVPKYDHSTTSIGKIIDSSIVEQLLGYKFQVKP